jgi:tetratricopeptide (TPR) repeat protein
MVDEEKGYDLYMNVYSFEGLQNSEIYRDENATGVFVGTGLNSLEIYNKLLRMGDTTRAVNLMEHLTEVYPEYWQSHLALSDLATSRGDTAEAIRIMRVLEDTLTAFCASNEENLFYLQDLGLAKTEIGRLTGDNELYDQGVELIEEAFDRNRNSGYAFRKLISVLSQVGRVTAVREVARKHAEYRINMQDGTVQRILGLGGTPNAPPQP